MSALSDCLFELFAGRRALDLWEDWVAAAVQTRADQQIYETGDPADDLYLLLDGCMCVRAGDEQRNVALILKAPALWGDIELLAGEPQRATSLDAVGVAKLFRFDAAALFEARTDARFLGWHDRDLAQRTHRVLINGGAARTLEQRVAHLIGVFGEELSPERLAKMTGATLKAVQRGLRKIDRTLVAPSSASFVHSISEGPPRAAPTRDGSRS